MANTDIRIAVSFKGHRKRKRLQRLLGFGAETYLIDLWITVAMDAPEGVLVGWDEEDIADACGWTEDPKKLINALIESNWIEKDGDGNYCLHDWCENQSWACNAKIRSNAAKKAAKVRWDGNNSSDFMQTACTYDAEGNADLCGPHAEGNAPYLTLPILTLPKEKTFSPELCKFTDNFIKFVLKERSNKAPKETKSLIENSLDTLDKLIRLDGFTLEYIQDVTRWAINDEFYSANFFSLAPLRSKSPNGATKFANMASKYDKQNNSVNNKTENNERMEKWVNR